jgi:hypothetical protein
MSQEEYDRINESPLKHPHIPKTRRETLAELTVGILLLGAAALGTHGYLEGSREPSDTSATEEFMPFID